MNFIGGNLKGCQKSFNVYSHLENQYVGELFSHLNPLGKNKVIIAKNCNKSDISPLQIDQLSYYMAGLGSCLSGKKYTQKSLTSSYIKLSQADRHKIVSPLFFRKGHTPARIHFISELKS